MNLRKPKATVLRGRTQTDSASTSRKKTFRKKKPAAKAASSIGRKPAAKAGRSKKSKPQTGEGLVRLNKYLADHGVASRRRCDELIESQRVSVDDEIVQELGLKIDPSKQRVEVNGVILRPEGLRMRYYLLCKPKGVVCTNSEREARPRAVDLITDRNRGRVFTVGRLDEESEGLILITNDGEFSQRIAHPSFGIPKTYRVQVRGKVVAEELDKIRRGVHLSEGKTGRVRVHVQKNSSSASVLNVTLYEGKNREVRRVFARVGYNVVGLRRTSIGNLTDRRLKPGAWRTLTATEVKELNEMSEASPEEVLAAMEPRPRSGTRAGVAAGNRRGARNAPASKPARSRASKPGGPSRSGAAAQGSSDESSIGASLLGQGGAGKPRKARKKSVRKKVAKKKTPKVTSKSVVQRRLGKSKQGKDKGAPTRTGAKKGKGK